MARPRPEPVQVVKQRRDAALRALVRAFLISAFSGWSSSAVATS